MPPGEASSARPRRRPRRGSSPRTPPPRGRPGGAPAPLLMATSSHGSALPGAGRGTNHSLPGVGEIGCRQPPSADLPARRCRTGGGCSSLAARFAAEKRVSLFLCPPFLPSLRLLLRAPPPLGGGAGSGAAGRRGRPQSRPCVNVSVLHSSIVCRRRCRACPALPGPRNHPTGAADGRAGARPSRPGRPAPRRARPLPGASGASAPRRLCPGGRRPRAAAGQLRAGGARGLCAAAIAGPGGRRGGVARVPAEEARRARVCAPRPASPPRPLPEAQPPWRSAGAGVGWAPAAGAGESAGSPEAPGAGGGGSAGGRAAVRAGSRGWAAPVPGGPSFRGGRFLSCLFMASVCGVFSCRQERLFTRLKRRNKALVVSRHRVSERKRASMNWEGKQGVRGVQSGAFC